MLRPDIKRAPGDCLRCAYSTPHRDGRISCIHADIPWPPTKVNETPWRAAWRVFMMKGSHLWSVVKYNKLRVLADSTAISEMRCVWPISFEPNTITHCGAFMDRESIIAQGGDD